MRLGLLFQSAIHDILYGEHSNLQALRDLRWRLDGNFLIISDLQIPFEADRALEFCLYLARHYLVPPENIYNVGDEVDQYFGSLYKKDPDGTHSPISEIRATKDKLKRWFSAFPHMKIATSNHGQRWAKRASEAEIPSQMMRKYQEVLETPDTWRWADSWRVPAAKAHFIVKHGLDCGGKTPYRPAAELAAISTAFGHLHSSAGLCHVRTLDKNVWAMNVGCLIDIDAYAFHYEKNNKFKPCLGAGVVLNGGRMPVWVPYG